MKQYTVDCQNYKIFKTNTNNEEPGVHFFWGKFDFRLKFESIENSMAEYHPQKCFSYQGKHFRAKRLEMMHHHQWYLYVKPTAHGQVLEEILWEREGKKHHVELPKNFFSVCQAFCAEELGLKPLVSKAA